MLSGATDFGYLGKQFDPQTGLYNYGYRDYASQVARFTTVDPIGDGNNWFSYVNNDPVNFVDLRGLSASDKPTTGPGAEFDSIESAAMDWANNHVGYEYLVTPQGNLIKYDYNGNKEIISSDLPKDPNL